MAQTKDQIKFTEEQLEIAQKLTDLQRKVAINHFARNMSQREAYIKAGGKAKTPESQDSAASRILSDVKVQAFKESLLQAAQSDAILSKSEALEILSNQARVRIDHIADFEHVIVPTKNPVTGEEEEHQQAIWSFKDLEDIPESARAAIKSVKATNKGLELDLHDNKAAIKQLAEMLGWNAPKQAELTGKDGAPIPVQSEVSAPEVAAALTGLLDKL